MPYIPTGEQQAILGHDPQRHARVLAGPGTGKSATLVALVDHLLEGNPAPRIKLLTFTRAATAELAKKVSDHPAAATERPSTIHSFSISVLLRNPGAGDFPKPLRIADKWEEKNILNPTLAHRITIDVRRLDDLIREMAANWEFLRPKEDHRVDPAERARFVGAWHEHREVYGYTLLAELPYALRQALHDHPDLIGVDYDLLVVDEYQDLNACDLEVLHLIADRGCSIIAAGDDDQSIYAFRYAAPEGIRRFPDDYPNCDRYPLSITQRCGRRIIEWASYVIAGDPDRPRDRPVLAPAEGSPDGEVALLSFSGEIAEAQGIATLVQQLIDLNHVSAEEILVLLRGDHNGAFSGPIKNALGELGIGYSDPEAAERTLTEPANRRLMASFRLLANPRDSLAWASLILLAPGVGQAFSNYIYERARVARVQFGEALFEAYERNFPDGPRSASRARTLIQSVTGWLNQHALPPVHPENGWGHWIVEQAGGDVVSAPTASCVALLHSLDGLAEAGEDFGRFLSQITPLAKDHALAERRGVRIMTMSGSKGLTVRATIIAAVEDGVMPRPDGDLAEERRLLYVAMTRAKEFLFATWAGQRRGPTARAGRARVGQLRRHTHFLDGGPEASQEGLRYLRQRGAGRPV